MKYGVLAAIPLAVVLSGCDADEPTAPGAEPPGYTYRVPERVAGDWETASLTEVGIAATPIATMITGRVEEQHSVLLVKDGKLVLEEYFDGEAGIWTEPWAEVGLRTADHIDYTRDTLHYQASVTKSFVSALIGIAIDEGRIDGVDQAIMDFFPDHAAYFEGDKRDITIGHLLTMQSGILWGDRDTWTMDHQQVDWVRFVLSRPMAASPGVVFRYNDGLSVLLAEIVGRAFESRADHVAEQYLFGPIGIDDFMWMRSRSDQIAGGWGLYLRPRDMARLGQLFLQHGRWGEEQIVSAGWTQVSTRAHVHGVAGPASYGYHWWHEYLPFGGGAVSTFSARGAGGQMIYVVPSRGLVVVFTAGGTSAFFPSRLLLEHILPACEP